MIRIIAPRRFGKTTKIIQKAIETDSVIVVPTYHYIAPVRDMVKDMYPEKEDLSDIKIIPFHDFMVRYTQHDNTKYYIDELDACLKTVGVLGYSNTIEEENQNGSKI